MTILHINTSPSWGGLEQYTAQFIIAQHTDGASVVAMVLQGSRLEAACRAAGVTTISVRRHAKANLASLRALRKAIVQCKATDGPCIVHSHTRTDVWTGALATLGMGVPLVQSLYMLATPKRDLVHRFIYGRVRAIVSSSVENNRRVTELYPIDPSKVHLIRYMRNPQRSARSAQARTSNRSAWGADDASIVVGVAARIDEQKGIREFVQSFDLVDADIRRRLHYVIVGEPNITGIDAHGTVQYDAASVELLQWVHAMASDASRSDHMHVMPFQADLAAVFSGMDVFVLPSYHEAYALTVIEAMMNGLCVIGTSTGSTPEQLADGRGMIIEPRSAEAIARAVETIAGDERERTRLADAGTAWACSEHEPRVVLDRWYRLYHTHLRS